MPIAGCNSTPNSAVSGTDAVYSYLESDSMILVKDNMGVFKNITEEVVNYFTIQQGGVNVILDPNLLQYSVESGSDVSLEIDSDPSGSLRIYFDQVNIVPDSFYVDFTYLYNGNTYVNRWTFDVVKDGLDNASLVYSYPSVIFKSSDHNYSTVVTDIERVAKEVLTSGMFKYKGDVVKIKFQAQGDSTTRIGNYLAVKIGSNNIYNNVFKYDIPQNVAFIGWYEITLTAINGDYTTAFLYNQQIQLNVLSLANSGSTAGETLSLGYQLNSPDNIMIPNTNLGSIQFVYNFIETQALNKYIYIWNFTIEKISNQNII